MSSFVIPIVGMCIPIILVPVILGLKHAKLERELEHKERMRALELGRTLPGDEPWASPPKIALTIGAAVPLGVYFCAWLATESLGYHESIWMAASGIGVMSVISGSLLAGKHFQIRAESERMAAQGHAKPYMDAGVFDDVSV